MGGESRRERVLRGGTYHCLERRVNLQANAVAMPHLVIGVSKLYNSLVVAGSLVGIGVSELVELPAQGNKAILPFLGCEGIGKAEDSNAYVELFGTVECNDVQDGEVGNRGLKGVVEMGVLDMGDRVVVGHCQGCYYLPSWMEACGEMYHLLSYVPSSINTKICQKAVKSNNLIK